MDEYEMYEDDVGEFSPIDAVTEERQRRGNLDNNTNSVLDAESELARLEYSYQTTKTRIYLELIASGVSATQANNTILGYEEVALCRLKRDLAKAKCKQLDHVINTDKLQIRVLENQISRDWNRPDGGLM